MDPDYHRRRVPSPVRPPLPSTVEHFHRRKLDRCLFECTRSYEKPHSIERGGAVSAGPGSQISRDNRTSIAAEFCSHRSYMADSITWLLITDVHFGLSGQKQIWPNFRAALRADIQKILKSAGPLDLVIFLGDLAQSAQKSEYSFAEQELLWLQKQLQISDKPPAWVFIPGNHDIARPGADSSAVLVAERWDQLNELQIGFWRDKNHDLRKAVQKAFSPYQRWLQGTRLPILPQTRGLIPGDFSATYQKGQLRLGIVGLNSAFLQLKSGDFRKKLVLDVSQVNSVCSPDPVEWAGANDINILLTHHPALWLTPSAHDHFLSEIFPPGRFATHFSGHLHEPLSTMEAKGGGLPRNVYQGKALFGIEGATGSSSKERSHGYSIGRWAIDRSNIVETIWPRTIVQKQDGSLVFDADQSYTLSNDNSLVREFQRNARDLIGTQTAFPLLGLQNESKDAETTEADFLRTKTASDAHSKLATAIRFRLVIEPHASAVREEQREEAVSRLKADRYCWLLADWGTGKDAFISTVLKALEGELDEATANYFHLRCDNAEKAEDIVDAARGQLGMPFQEFLICARSLKNSYLILDGVGAKLCSEDTAEETRRTIRLALDLGGDLRIIVVSRNRLPGEKAAVQIGPLDLPDTRIYLQSHPDFPSEITSADIIERLYESSGGLPAHLDRVIARLRFASLDTVLAEEDSAVKGASEHNEVGLHKGLLQAIEVVEARDKEDGSRGRQLLQILTVLPYGETIEALKHFIHDSPMYLRDAVLLESCALLDIVPLSQFSPVIRSKALNTEKGLSAPKLLRVPRQVRDCVSELLPAEHKGVILDHAAEFYFGKSWRFGRKPKLRRVSPELRPYVGRGVGNEFAVLQLMIEAAIQTNEDLKLKNAIGLALHYCNVLRATSRNRDLRLASTRLLRVLEGQSVEKEIGELHRLAGRACRMDDHKSEAIFHFEEYVDSAASRAGSEATNNALLELVECLVEAGDESRAKEIIERVKQTAKESSPIASTAQSKLFEMLENPEERYNSLKNLEEFARGKAWTSLADDIAISLCYKAKDSRQKLFWLDRVLKDRGHGWNRHRAIVNKALLKDVQMSMKDRADLLTAYIFCHNQRNLMFNRCHTAIWNLLERDGDNDALFRVFLHSSFIWRLRGDEEQEMRYFQRLQKAAAVNITEAIPAKRGLVTEVLYFLRRAKLFISRTTP